MNQSEPPLPVKGPSIFAFSDKDARVADLRTAIDRGAIDVFFQPQIDAQSGRVVGAEALARWNHPEFGELGARELFSLARDANLVPALSRQVAGKALGLAKGWSAHLHLAINITPQELDESQFEASFSRLINEAGFPVERLVLEITEDQPINDVQRAAEVLTRFKSNGIRIALDDFGAGYCNFNYLKQLPLDMLKLDRSIVEGIEGNPRDRAVMRSILDLAIALELDVVAEGIETEGQRKIATEEGCNCLQGFLIAKPVEAAALLGLLEA